MLNATTDPAVAVAEAGAVVVVPLVVDADHGAEVRRELAAPGLDPFELREPCDGVIVPADDSSDARLSPGDLPGCKVVYDGRDLLDRASLSAAGVDARALGTR